MADGQSPVQQFIGAAVGAGLAAAGQPPQPAAGIPPRSAPLDIAIPVFNGRTLLTRCLDALLPTLADGDTVWLIDDASDEPGIPETLEEFRDRWPATRVLRNPRNLGFVDSANLALAATSRDVVLLNSDTEPLSGWLAQMQACLQRNPNAGIICPLSDRATILSVVPDNQTAVTRDLADAVAGSTIGDVALPTAVGFCMLLRRAMLDEIGGFSRVFAPGYGEENDLSMRALKLGWDIVAADRACVLHRARGSFGAERGARLQASHQSKLERLWPEYTPLVQSWWRDNPLRAKTEQLAWAGDDRPGVVHVLHRQYHVGGTERVTRMLIQALGERYRHTLVYPGDTQGQWCDLELRATELCRELMLNRRWIKPGTLVAGHGADLACPQSERALARILHGAEAGLVHLHHMLHWDSLLLPALAHALGCRVVISVHDLWFNCPVHNQLEFPGGRPCERRHAQADERCGKCLAGYATHGLARGKPGQDPGEYALARHAVIRHALERADAVLVPSDFIRNRLLAAYPMSGSERVRVMPHGVQAPTTALAPRGGAARVLAYFGGDQELKGAVLVLQMAQAMRDSGVSFKIWGRIKGFDPATLPPNVELCGFYNPADVSLAMEGVDLALLPSHYEESFSMVASECWAHGIPVLGSARGALRERILTGVNGWLVPDMAADTWIRSLRMVLQGDTIERCREKLAGHAVTTIEAAAGRLDRLYQELLARAQRSPEPVDRVAGATHFNNKVRELRESSRPAKRPSEGACLGIVRDRWGTPNYRVRFPLEALARADGRVTSRFHVVRDAGFDVRSSLDQARARHVAVQPFLSDEGLRLMEWLHRESRHRITLVVDDLWTDLPRDNPVRARMPEDVPGRLAYAASLSHALVLTTPELERRLGLRHQRTHVINNALPGWVWDAARPAARAPRRGRQRIGWAGAPQHAGDLAFLEPVMRATADLADWVFLGMCPEHLRPLASEVCAMVPFADYPAALAQADLDLAVAPLTDHPFNRCKSHLKVLEYGILGLPVIACDLEPYRQCPVTLAAADDREAWVANIRRLLQDPDERSAQARRLRQWVLDNHMLEHRIAEWRAALGIPNAPG